MCAMHSILQIQPIAYQMLVVSDAKHDNRLTRRSETNKANSHFWSCPYDQTSKQDQR